YRQHQQHPRNKGGPIGLARRRRVRRRHGETTDPPDNARIGSRRTRSLRIHPRPNPNPHRITPGGSLSTSHERIPSHLSISGIVFLTSISLHSTSQHGWGHLFPGATRDEKLLRT